MESLHAYDYCEFYGSFEDFYVIGGFSTNLNGTNSNKRKIIIKKCVMW